MTTHIERTANAPRQSGLHNVILSQIRPLNKTVRLLKFALPYAITFLPGQWVDLHVPGLPSPGGFTIVSSPRDAVVGESLQSSLPTRSQSALSQVRSGGTLKGHEKSTLESELARRMQATRFPVEQSLSTDHLQQWQKRQQQPQSQQLSSQFISLAVQLTSNPPARWLWRAPEDILGQELQMKIGGSFVWPPPNLDSAQIKKVIFIAGGVGINPFVSMLKHMYEEPDRLPPQVVMLYGHKSEQDMRDIPFLNSLARRFEDEQHRKPGRKLEVFLTGDVTAEYDSLVTEQWSEVVAVHKGRMTEEDVLAAAAGGGVEESGRTDGETVAYVCGPGGFVDENVTRLQNALGGDRVFFEKWW